MTIGGGTSPLLAGLATEPTASDEVTIGGGVSPSLAGLAQEPSADNVTVDGGGVSPSLAGLVQEPAAQEVTVPSGPAINLSTDGDAVGAIPAGANGNMSVIDIYGGTQATIGSMGMQDVAQPGITVGADSDGGLTFTDSSGTTDSSDSIAGYDPVSGDAVLNPD